MTIIYALKDPAKDFYCYVGLTIDPDRRLLQHIQDTQSRALYPITNSKKNWIAYLLECDRLPEMITLEVCPANLALEKEKEWIKRLIVAGHPITNADSYNAYENCPYTNDLNPDRIKADIVQHRPPAIYHFDLTRLKGQLSLFD